MTETKYYLAGTDEEVLVGDVIETTLVKEFGDGRSITRKISFELSEESIPYALDMHIIEQKEDEDLVDFNDEEDEEEPECPIEGMIDDIMEDYEKLEERVEKLEDSLKIISKVEADMNKMGYDFTQFFHELVEDFKNRKSVKKETASPKKK